MRIPESACFLTDKGKPRKQNKTADIPYEDIKLSRDTGQKSIIKGKEDRFHDTKASHDRIRFESIVGGKIPPLPPKHVLRLENEFLRGKKSI